MVDRTLAVVHNNIDGRSAIGALARWAARGALERGWRVLAVCRDLDDELRPEVDHCPLYVPPRLHALQWGVARPTVRAAVRGRSYDAMLTYQAQVAAIADVWHAEYLSRAARQARIPPPPGWRGAVSDAQARAVAMMEDAHLRRLPASTRVLFCSDGMLADYSRLYGDPPNAGVLYNPALTPLAPQDRVGPDADRRAAGVGGSEGLVIGFLGGGDPRKGGDLILEAMRREPHLFLVHAGPGTLPIESSLVARTRGMGHLDDVTQLLDVVDVLMVPSRYEPFGMVVADAAARGVPVIVTEQVGAAPLVRATGSGAVWSPPAALTPIVTRLVETRAAASRGGYALAERLSPERLADQLFAELDDQLERRTAGR